MGVGWGVHQYNYVSLLIDVDFIILNFIISLLAGKQGSKAEQFVRILYEAATGASGSSLPVVTCRAMPTSGFPSKRDDDNDIWLLNKDAVDDLSASPTWAGVLAELAELADLKQQHGFAPSNQESKKFACLLAAVWSMQCFQGNVSNSGKFIYY